MTQALFEKYNVRVPRYTSYPALPDWSDRVPSEKEWIKVLNRNLEIDPEVSVYIHLPFCENLCTYCACNKRITKNHGVESPYVDRLIDEWNIYNHRLGQTPVIKELHLGGGTPTFFSPKELDRLLGAILNNTKVSNQQNFAFEAHPNSTTDEHLSVLFDHGFRRISIGVQDVNNEILRAINRFQTKEQIEHVTLKARETGYDSINYDIIYGLPFQTIENIEANVDFVLQMMPDRLAFYGYAHVPWKSKGQRAFTDYDIAKGKEKQQLKNHGDYLLLEAGYKPIGMDHYALENDALYQSQKSGLLHRNFMGFTEHHTRCLIGLGNSAISDCTEMYVQNEKVVEGYQTSIQNEMLPIIKGHQLSSVEQRTKQHILNLICNNRLIFSNDDLDQELYAMAKDRLKELENDQIIRMDGRDIILTDTGFPFVRNVCAAIDPYMYDISNAVRYSMAI